MEKIIKALLESKFPTIEVSLLLEVISNTPDSMIATEILCGLYVEPVVNPQPQKGFRNQETNFKVLGYNKFTKEVNYSYNQIPYTEYWVKNGETAPEYGTEGLKYTSGMYYNEDVAKKLGISKEEVQSNYKRVCVYGLPSEKVCTSKTCISNWN